MRKMTLKQKAEYYRKTQRYLAQKEEDTYIIKNIRKWYIEWAKNKRLREDFDDNFGHFIGLQIGLWQSKYGFYLTTGQVFGNYANKKQNRKKTVS